jgi:hypothetical protein
MRALEFHLAIELEHRPRYVEQKHLGLAIQQRLQVNQNGIVVPKDRVV